MKILITSIKYPGIVGVSTYIEQLNQGLKADGHHVDLFFHNPFSINKGANQNTIANFQAAASNLPFENYDVIHSQGIIPTIAVSRIKPKHIPLVSSLHGALAFNMLINGALKKNTPAWKQSLDVESRAIISSDICIVGSQWLKNIVLTNYKVPASQPFAVVPYGIDIDQFVKKMQVPPSTVTPVNKFVIACTGRLVPLKGHQFLLQSLAKLKRHRQDWICWLIGEGPLRNQLQQQADKLGLRGHIKFLGNQKNVAALLNAADLFVFPSLQDNMPYAVMEAQISGVPVVTTNAGGIPEMVTHGQTGLISPVKNIHTFFMQMNMLLGNAQFRESLANNAKAMAFENFSIDTMIKNTIDVYQNAMRMKN